MTNKEAKNKLKRLVVELEILAEENFSADKKENIGDAIRLLEDVQVWSD